MACEWHAPIHQSCPEKQPSIHRPHGLCIIRVEAIPASQAARSSGLRTLKWQLGLRRQARLVPSLPDVILNRALPESWCLVYSRGLTPQDTEKKDSIQVIFKSKRCGRNLVSQMIAFLSTPSTLNDPYSRQQKSRRLGDYSSSPPLPTKPRVASKRVPVIWGSPAALSPLAPALHGKRSQPKARPISWAGNRADAHRHDPRAGRDWR